VRHNPSPHITIGGSEWERWLANHCAQEPSALCAEIEPKSARLELIKQCVTTLGAERCQELLNGKQPLVPATGPPHLSQILMNFDKQEICIVPIY